MLDSAQQHRHCTLSLTPRPEALSEFVTLTADAPEHGLIVTHDIAHNTSDIVNPKIGFNALKNVLGHTYHAILLDFSKGVNLSALAILAGTIEGGGSLILHLGPDWLDKPDEELGRFLPWPLTPGQQRSFYKTLFWQSLTDIESPFTEQWPTKIESQPESQTCDARQLTQDQQNLVRAINSSEPENHLLLAPRGRGKSYALGQLLANAHNAGQSVMATASAPQNAVTLKEAYERNSRHLKTPFSAPDALLASSDHYDLLVVDEAASLPLPVLDDLQEKASTLVFSTTDYGYEGSGRGFGLKFKEHLKNQAKPMFEHRLTEPLRWADNDPLERWLDDLLFKEYEADITYSEQPECLQGQEWLSHPKLLDQAFALLVNAHYQTTPDNKRWLVDDPSVKCFLHYKSNQLIGVALISEEGLLPEPLAREVAQGRRRPRGHLLPQSLLAHEGIEDAANYLYWRVSRIAIAPHVRHQGHGSRLLTIIQRYAQQNDVDFVSTSFAATADVLKFWQVNGYVSVRLGTSKDQASGHYSLMMIKACSSKVTPIQTHWQSLFARQWWLSKPLQLRSIDDAVSAAIESELPIGEYPPLFELTAKDVSDLTYFCDHHRPYDTIRAPLLVFTKSLLASRKLNPDEPCDALLLGCSRNRLNESDAQALGYSGKKAFYQTLKKIVKAHLSSL